MIVSWDRMCELVHEMFAPTPDSELERQMMDECEPKSEREHWASREITRLRQQVSHDVYHSNFPNHYR